MSSSSFRPSASFQSTLPVGGATGLAIGFIGLMMISIHAPRGGSDRGYPLTMPPSPYFNPRSPWGERH